MDALIVIAMNFSQTVFSNMKQYSVCILLILTVCRISALKKVKSTVPLAAKVHDTIVLRCDYDLEGEPLYTVKWYKGKSEIFRFVPKEDPNMQIFSIQGVQVDLSRSNANEIVLIDVQPEVTGRYSCEVSTDAPNFYTKSSSGFLHIVELPKADPIIEVDKVRTGHTSIIRANCTTPPSYPPMNVTWYINGIKVMEIGRRSVSLDPVFAYSKKLRPPHMTISHVEKEVDENTFQDGPIKVQCISTLFNIYKSENVRYIDNGSPQPWPSSVIGFTNKATNLELTGRTIWISVAVALAEKFTFAFQNV